MFKLSPNSEVQEITEPFMKEKGVRLFVLREDLSHPIVSGNKWRKLKYNLIEAAEKGHQKVLTFGGAYSNHIVATAHAAADCGLSSVGIIRGEEHLPLNETLKQAVDAGMQLYYISREEYRNKSSDAFLTKLEKEHGRFYLIPEGGSNHLAVKGCAEMLDGIDLQFDVICCACGTGGTLAGLIVRNKGTVYGFPALKGGSFLTQNIEQLIGTYLSYQNSTTTNANWELINDYHFGGYAKINEELVDFVKLFKSKHHIELDLIYTGKMFFGLYDIIRNSDKLINQCILAVHTGGVQGNRGFKQRFGVVI